MNNKIKTLKEIRKVLALFSTVACISTMTGCSNDGFRRDDYENVQNQISDNTEELKQQIINNCIYEGRLLGLSDEEINMNIKKALKENGFLQDVKKLKK